LAKFRWSSTSAQVCFYNTAQNLTAAFKISMQLQRSWIVSGLFYNLFGSSTT